MYHIYISRVPRVNATKAFDIHFCVSLHIYIYVYISTHICTHIYTNILYTNILQPRPPWIFISVCLFASRGHSTIDTRHTIDGTRSAF